jgi:hypothetical protein
MIYIEILSVKYNILFKNLSKTIKYYSLGLKVLR